MLTSTDGSNPAQTPPSETLPLFVDLQGVLLQTDIKLESTLLAVKRRPLSLFTLPFHFIADSASFQRHLPDLALPDASLLPYRPEVVEFLRKQKAANRKTVLVHDIDQRIADHITAHLGCFDEAVEANTQQGSLGPGTLPRIQQLCAQHGWTAFAHLGKPQSDGSHWRWEENVYDISSPTTGVIKKNTHTAPIQFTSEKQTLLKPLVKSLRPHQWVKNLLVFLPMILAHQINPANLLLALAAFTAFSLVAASVYISNDMLDIESDRRHRTKRNRPFASGRLPLWVGLVLLPLLLLLGFAVSLMALPPQFTLLLAVYVIATILYSFWLKSCLLIDVFMLAGLYSLRLFAGGLAVQVAISDWLLMFSIFFFLSLAFVKRYVELAHQVQRNLSADITPNKARAYQVGDLPVVQAVGVASGFAAAVVFFLYLKSESVARLYADSRPVWFISLLLIYWITRVWFLAQRGQVADDPIVSALTDRVSWFIALCIGILILLAIRGLPF